MTLSKKPDYKQYSLSELHDVKEHIDKEAYPDRYRLLIEEIELRKQLPEPKAESRVFSKTEKVFILKSVMLLVAVFLSHSLFKAYKTGGITARGGDEYYLATNPMGFYFIVVFHGLFLFYAIYFVFFSSDKDY
ncbi:hypothetical protein [Shewanella fidelis]|uniref:Uncharacterized protein n=1 Tax=Shewanella fidelis TaxID=173509 RepID=A0AAW8NQU7_9GAMM|nr:hypothetical protein [Shewanella fidelis]MDR8525584.1 hypothetical protein [Shewanella fidelis]MDW4813097.1 hypothetical protein [Shewanella fidelis]MDW4817023.1 hypothetical protein [Shewanella fidelis]MDW4820182.1 hypothetical protein [Shewanella fidelis]MDW4825562.1 hypothetical protein [Shewanella fidelis]